MNFHHKVHHEIHPRDFSWLTQRAFLVYRSRADYAKLHGQNCLVTVVVRLQGRRMPNAHVLQNENQSPEMQTGPWMLREGYLGGWTWVSWILRYSWNFWLVEAFYWFLAKKSSLILPRDDAMSCRRRAVPRRRRLSSGFATRLLTASWPEPEAGHDSNSFREGTSSLLGEKTAVWPKRLRKLAKGDPWARARFPQREFGWSSHNFSHCDSGWNASQKRLGRQEGCILGVGYTYLF